MTVFAYTSGDPSHLAAGTNASMADMQGPLVDIRTFLNGNISDVNLSASAAVSEAKLATGSSGLAKGAFHAHRNAGQSIATGVVTPTIVNFNAELYDVSGWHDITTNVGRFTPQVPGYYRFSWHVGAGTQPPANTVWQTILRKNGADAAQSPPGVQVGTALNVASGGSAVAQANGTTDFFEVAVWHNAGLSVNTGAQSYNAFFQGELIGRS